MRRPGGAGRFLKMPRRTGRLELQEQFPGGWRAAERFYSLACFIADFVPRASRLDDPRVAIGLHQPGAGRRDAKPKMRRDGAPEKRWGIRGPLAARAWNLHDPRRE
jgi:hypothetical protein